MDPSLELPNCSDTRQILLRTRPDLVLSQHDEDGKVWIVQDPLGANYYWLSAQEVFILEALHGQTSLQDIKTQFEREFVPRKISLAQLHAYLASLHAKSLLLSDSRSQGEQLLTRSLRKQRQVRLTRISNLLAIRLRGVDPDRFVTWLYRRVRWLYSEWWLAACALVVLAAGLLVTVQWSVLRARLPQFHEFFNVSNLVWLAIATAGIKVLHELGHALTCKHFGRECREAGLMFLVFTPTLYCDVSDSWMLASKWQRAAIASAGMAVELVLASIATFVWWLSAPGLLHYLSLNTMFVCSLSTLVFNGNPLMRLDGYYILSDLWETPNLWHNSRNALLERLKGLCFGLNSGAAPARLPASRALLYAYALSSIVYCWFILVAILWFVLKAFQPFRLEILGQMLVIVTVSGLAIAPLVRFARFLARPGTLKQLSRVRTLATLGGALSLLSVIFLLPLPYRIVTSMSVEPRASQRVYVSVPGFLDEAPVTPGELVRPGQPLATLRSPDVDFELAKLEGEFARQAARVASLERQRIHDPQSPAQLSHSREALSDLEQRVSRRRQDRERLTLKAPVAGMVLPPSACRAEARADAACPPWQGTPFEPGNRGAYLETGTLLCSIGNLHDLEAVLVVDQSEIGFVARGQQVDLVLDAFPTAIVQGNIAEISEAKVASAPSQLSSRLGGDLATRKGPQGEEQPSEISYWARVRIDNLQNRVLLGFRGRAKIHAEKATLAQRLGRYLSRTFQFDR